MGGSAELLCGPAARAAAVSTLAGRVDVLHVAAHGRHSADNPLFSGLELADGPWFGYDIDQLASIPSTVILSACEPRSVLRAMGRGDHRDDGGVDACGGTVRDRRPASVADDVACEVLMATHARLADSAPPAEALADAVRSVDGGDLASFLTFGAGW